MKDNFPITEVQQFINTLPDYKSFKVEKTGNGGVSTDVFRLVSGSSTRYLRVALEGRSMSSEILAHKLLAGKGVKLPEVLNWQENPTDLGRSYIVTSEIPGVPAKNESDLPEKVFFEAGKQLALINSIPVDGFGWIDRRQPNVTKLRGIYSSYQEFALNNERIENMLNDLIMAEVIKNDLKGRYLRYVEERKNLVKCDQSYLSHGDFGNSHIFVNNSKYSGIIDFGDIRCTSVYHDLAHYYTYSSERFTPLLTGYQSVYSLGDDYMPKIEFVAMLFVIGKLWWMSKNYPKPLNRKRDEFKLLSRVLRG